MKPPTIDGTNWRMMLRTLREGLNVTGLSEREARKLRQAAGRHVPTIHCRAVPDGVNWKVEVPDG